MIDVEEKKVSHLALIVAELANGRDVLELSTAEGGILLDDDENDVLELVTEIVMDVVPNYCKGNWPAFLLVFMQVLANAKTDGTGDTIADIRYWVDKVYEDGKMLV